MARCAITYSATAFLILEIIISVCNSTAYGSQNIFKNQVKPCIRLFINHENFSHHKRFNHGLPENLHLIFKAAEQGDANAQHLLGYMYDSGNGLIKNIDLAIYWYKKAAVQGHARSQVNLGFIYDLGKNTDQDIKKALYWYTKAAEQGIVIAQCNLGLLYYTPDGFFQNFDKAAYWFSKAADQGDRHAQANLGCMYARGHGVSQNYILAFVWFHLAAIQGNGIAKNNLDRLTDKMTMEQIAEALEYLKNIKF